MNKPPQHELISLAKYYQAGQSDKAEKLALSMIKKFPKYQFAWKVLGAVLRQTGRGTEALAVNKKSVELSPKDFEAHNNLGITFKELGRLGEAEVSLKKTITLKSDFHEAHNNLGIVLGTMNRFEEAELSCKHAVALKPEYAEGHNSLGIMLKELKKFDEAEVSFRNAISLKPDYAEAYNNLGITIAELGRLDEAEINCRKALSLEPDLFKIFISNRPVEKKLLAYLYKIKLIDLDKENDPSFGNTRGSKYELFDDNHPIIKTLEEDLTKIMMKAVKSEIYIFASFFSIFGAGGGTKRHNHINSKDRISILNLAKQKYSLVYYLSVGDQECKEPGLLKIYEPNEDILPNEGLITIFSADREHSSSYGGNKDRVIVGVNFYSL